MFSLSIAKEIVTQSESQEFVVDFDLVWQWLGYSKKSNALRVLQKEFSESIDFTQMLKNEELEFTKPTTKYYLTVDAVKAFCMMANTEQGKQVRLYFIEAEKELRQLKVQPIEEVKPVRQNFLPNSFEVADMMAKLESTTLPAQVKQLLIDKMTDEFLTQKQLPGTSDRWLGVAQKAEEMGYKVDLSNRSTLGRSLSKLNLERKKEARLCNGTMREINVYKDTPQLESAIAGFFEGLRKAQMSLFN